MSILQIKTGPRIRDVAEAAGVSKTTVSLVANGLAEKVGISLATRNRVASMIRELGYIRSPAAFEMATGRMTPDAIPPMTSLASTTPEPPPVSPPPPQEPDPALSTLTPAPPPQEPDPALSTPTPAPPPQEPDPVITGAPTTINQEPTTPAPLPRQDDPCPCGSGKKYKKCHGKWRPVETGPQPNLSPSPPVSPLPQITTNPQPITVTKPPSRDDLCPCGSGKKYKKCHGKWQSAETGPQTNLPPLPPVSPLPQTTTNPQPITEAKPPGPDDPCPCGSGKKYKKCHGKWGGPAG